MVLNPKKCVYMLTDIEDQPDEKNLNGTEIKSDHNEKLLGFVIDKKLSLDAQTKSLWK